MKKEMENMEETMYQIMLQLQNLVYCAIAGLIFVATVAIILILKM